MGERRERLVERGKARTGELKERIPDVKELKGRVPELRDRIPERERVEELRNRSVELARQYAKMDVTWARCRHVRALRDGLLDVRAQPADGPLHAPPHRRARRLPRPRRRP